MFSFTTLSSRQIDRDGFNTEMRTLGSLGLEFVYLLSWFIVFCVLFDYLLSKSADMMEMKRAVRFGALLVGD